MTVRDVANSLTVGQTIYDSAGQRVGTVDLVDRRTGWLKAEVSPLTGAELYIPFSLITDIDRRELSLSEPEHELRRDYTKPPARFTAVEVVQGEPVATTRQASGYDGALVVVEATGIDQLRHLINVGDLVLSSDMTELGRVKQYDASTGWILVRKGLRARNDLLVPLTVVSEGNRHANEVYLVASQADLRGTGHPIKRPADRFTASAANDPLRAARTRIEARPRMMLSPLRWLKPRLSRP